MGRKWIALLANSHAWPVGSMLFFVWGGFFVPSYSSLVFALVNRGGEHHHEQRCCRHEINLFLCIVTNDPGAVWLSATNRHCTAVSRVCWSVAYLLSIASLIWKGFFAHHIFFQLEKLASATLCFLKRKVLYIVVLIMQLVPFPLHMFLLRGQTSLGQLGE